MYKLTDIIPIFPVLYAEIHYTFKGFSLVKRKWPEILSDAPFRVEPGLAIPLLILVKDAHHYPIIFHPPRINVLYPDSTVETLQLNQDPIPIDKPLWFKVINIQPKKGFYGKLEIDIIFDIHDFSKPRLTDKINPDKRISGRMTRNRYKMNSYPLIRSERKHHTFRIDNYRGSSHCPLQVSVAQHSFPRFKNWLHSDLHHHSLLTNDQVEFGAPLKAISAMAKSMGFSFVAITDHAYDLDDKEDDYLHNDPRLPKWLRLHEMAEQIEKQDDFIFIPGEEVSCGNHRGRNIHLITLNNKRFFPGSGDSAEHWFKTKPEHSLNEILDNLEEKALAFAAHPEVPFPPLQWILLHRGKWGKADYEHPRLAGLQIHNGIDDTAFHRGIQQWIRLLLEGRKLSIIAGNDAHGSFNRFYKLGLPFLYLKELQMHLFGRVRTALFINGKPDREKVIQALNQRQCYITTGPSLIIEVQNDKHEKAILGGELSGKYFRLTVRGISTEEFGHLTSCKIWLGDLTKKKEQLLKEFNQFKEKYCFASTLTLDNFPNNFYLRAQLTTNKNDQKFFCLTNPIWIHGHS